MVKHKSILSWPEPQSRQAAGERPESVRTAVPSITLPSSGKGYGTHTTDAREEVVMNVTPPAAQRWPELPYGEFAPTMHLLQMGLQMAGKLTLLKPFEPQWANVVLGLTSRGLTTGPIPGRAERSPSLPISSRTRSRRRRRGGRAEPSPSDRCRSPPSTTGSSPCSRRPASRPPSTRSPGRSPSQSRSPSTRPQDPTTTPSSRPGSRCCIVRPG